MESRKSIMTWIQEQMSAFFLQRASGGGEEGDDGMSEQRGGFQVTPLIVGLVGGAFVSWLCLFLVNLYEKRQKKTKAKPVNTIKLRDGREVVFKRKD
ncbi:hypothetical protein PVAG01_01775 [Phlyctema vagabunda]|uniref:Uncharacterized protein n=1 Tax=Phlyctema vagabunda TaxID=108571 RepID=A0ABR4PY52_9HELO